MGLFEDMYMKAKSAVDVVGGKAGQIVDISRLNINMAELKGQMNKLFEDLGSSIYYAHKNGTPDEAAHIMVENKLREIDNIYSEMESLASKIAETKNKMACKNCGYQNENGSSYCSKCGRPLEIKCEANEHQEAEPEKDN